jgi:hypothetical protein
VCVCVCVCQEAKESVTSLRDAVLRNDYVCVAQAIGAFHFKIQNQFHLKIKTQKKKITCASQKQSMFSFFSLIFVLNFKLN